MCWRSSTLVTKNSGDEKIPIYKVLGITYGTLKAFFHDDFLYTLNHTYECKVNPERYAPNLYFINEGLHCYSDKCRFKYNYSSVSIGLIAAQRYPDSLYTTAVIAKGYIPPNTTYYINEEGEIVTESLVLTELMTDNVLDI